MVPRRVLPGIGTLPSLAYQTGSARYAIPSYPLPRVNILLSFNWGYHLLD
jgi:hypothetical protein